MVRKTRAAARTKSAEDKKQAEEVVKVEKTTKQTRGKKAAADNQMKDESKPATKAQTRAKGKQTTQ